MKNNTDERAYKQDQPPRLGLDETYNYDRFRVGLYNLDQLTGPEVGEEAPDFVAETLGGHEIHLSDYRGRLVVLVTGSYTSPQYIDKIGAMNLVAQRYPEATFLTLYVREAHPGNKVPSHRNIEDKRALAQRTVNEDGERAELLIDDLNGSAHRMYGGLPNSGYVIDERGTVVARGAWNNPRVVEKALDRIKSGESLSGIRSDLIPVSPLTMARVLNRAGEDALNDVLAALPSLVTKQLLASVKDVNKLYR